MRKSQPITVGITGAVGLVSLFFVVVSLVNSLTYALDEFSRIWYWVLLLASGFGLQLGLYRYIKIHLKQKLIGAAAEVAASGTISTGSMVACCSHAVVNLLPFLGLSAAALFLAQYQLPLILLGVFFNWVGITIMLGIIQKHNLYKKGAISDRVFRIDMKKLRNGLILFSIIVISLAAVYSKPEAPATLSVSSEVVKFKLPARTNDQNLITIEVKPNDFGLKEPLSFDVSINTHSVALDFDLAAVSFLEDDRGNIYKPLSWDGDPPGDHHRSGTLSFPMLSKEAGFIRLTIKDISGVSERIFEWELK